VWAHVNSGHTSWMARTLSFESVFTRARISCCQEWLATIMQNQIVYSPAVMHAWMTKTPLQAHVDP